MSKINKADLSYWAAVYNKLNGQHDLWHTHKITFDQFIADPEHNRHWITVYFANPALLVNRPHGAAVLLQSFLQAPDYLLISVLMAESLRIECQPTARELLPKQSVAAALVQWTAEPHDERLHLHGDRYVQPLKRHGHECIGKYKTHGSHRKAAKVAAG